MIDYKFINEFNTRLTDKGLTIAFAESITAGLIASSIASVKGASTVLKGGIVTYDQVVKKQLLNVKQATLDKYTAEAKETSEEMVNGLQALKLGAKGDDFGADICVAITGVASKPTTNYKINKKVGDVFLSIKYNGIVKNYYENLSKIEDEVEDERNNIRERAVYMALNNVLLFIEQFEN